MSSDEVRAEHRGEQRDKNFDVPERRRPIPGRPPGAGLRPDNPQHMEPEAKAANADQAHPNCAQGLNPLERHTLESSTEEDIANDPGQHEANDRPQGQRREGVTAEDMAEVPTTLDD